MLAQDSYEYIKIGLALRLLRNVNSEFSVEDIKEVIEDLQGLFELANFSVSIASTQSERYTKIKKILESEEAGSYLNDAAYNAIRVEHINLENVVFAEALTKKIYVIPERRFNKEFLLNSPNRLLKDGAFAKLEDIAKSDFSSACRCILFGEATAAAFHILRATESVLKSYYFHHRRQNRLPKPMWAAMTEQLKNKKRNRPPEALLTSLDLIRVQYRNPTNHPEVVYQIDSAQDLFGVCLDVMGKMAEEL